MKKIIKKSENYTLEKVDERISFYQQKEIELEKNNSSEDKKNINSKLLLFWNNYKTKNFQDEKKE